jgi:hypothetical protein
VQSMDGESDGRGSGKIPDSPRIKKPQACIPEAFLSFTSFRSLPLHDCICLSFAKATKSPAITLRTRMVTMTTIPR